ncbi:hypothetical protein BJX76DRAFT_339512 [Aspergillus varians]
MPRLPMNYGTVMRMVEPQQVLLNSGPLNKTPNDTQWIYPMQNRPNGKRLKDRKRRIYCLILRIRLNKQRTRTWKRVKVQIPRSLLRLIPRPGCTTSLRFPLLWLLEAPMVVFFSDAPPGRRVTVTFHVYEQGGWRKTDIVSVSPDHLAEAQMLTDWYARDLEQNACFYDGRLCKVTVDECVLARLTMVVSPSL